MPTATESLAIDPHTPPLSAATPLTAVQPGGGICFDLEAAWGRLRRARLRIVRPGYVHRMAERRQGRCDDCPHDIIDARDLKLYRNVCGYWFKPEDDPFRWRERLRFARYGLAELVIATIGCAAATVTGALAARSIGQAAFWLLAVPAAVVFGHAVWFFRDPTRVPPDDPHALISPADGVVTHIDEVDAPGFPGGRAARVSIYLSIWNVHLNRMPRRAHVRQVRYFPGAFLNARHRDCVQRNEQVWIDFEEPNGRQLRIKQISGALARRLVCWVKLDEEVAAGERFGMIKFGSRTDVLIPVGESVERRAAVGDIVHAGTSVLLRFRSEAP